jgi:ferrous iron transport protein B
MSHGMTLETVALAGNPNAGKTTLFNALTGANQKVGNYAGVTVDRKTGEFFTPHGKKLTLIDLPGCYSLDGASIDQQIAKNELIGENPEQKRPDLVVCVVDASNLERHLVLAAQIIELGLPVVIALNMVDMAEKMGLRLDPTKLSEELGVPVVPIQANAGKGIVQLKHAMTPPHPHVADCPWLHGSEEGLSGRRRTFILRVCEQAARRPEVYNATLSDKLDAIFLHPVFGWISFVVVMMLIFWAIFSFAAIPMGWIESMQGWLAEFVSARMAEGDLKNLLVDGVIGGAGTVVVFLPQIVLLFFFIGLLESSGYMARAAYLMDGVMARAGLSGKSFLPLFSSYACAIPGILASRTIDSPKERLVTIFVSPWMSCSARLPVYLVLVPMLMGSAASKFQQALIFIAIYTTGTVTAFFVARILRGRLGKDDMPNHFLLELPPYRLPQWSYIFRHVGGRAAAFLKNAGTLILAISIILWALQTYPKSSSEDPAERLSYSAIGRVSNVIAPLVKPLGFDGRTGTAILTSFAAREVFVNSMAQLFHVDKTDDDEQTFNSLRNTLREQKWPDGRLMFNIPAVLSLIVFYIYALQCLPTSAVVIRESGSVRWAVMQFIFMTIFAWTASFIVFQVSSLFFH